MKEWGQGLQRSSQNRSWFFPATKICCSSTVYLHSLVPVNDWGQKASLPFFGWVLLLLLHPSFSSLSSRSLQRRTCSSLIFRNRILFCSSLRASSTSGSTHMSSRILASILPLFLGQQRRPSASPWVLFQQRGTVAPSAPLRVSLPFLRRMCNC